MTTSTPLPPRPRRRFSKQIVIANVALCWAVIFASIVYSLESIGVAALGIIGTCVGAYMGVGHLDYRSVLNNFGTPSDDTGQDTQ